MSREGHSDCEGDQDPVPTSDPPLPPVASQLERVSASFEWLASGDLESLFAKRACLKAVPRFMKGAYRSAMRIALAEIDEGRSHHAILRASRGWKLFLLLPRLLLHRSPRGGKIPKAVESGHLFWPANERIQPVEFRLLRVASDVQPATMSRAARAEALVHMGEALEGAALAPGTDATLAMLQNPLKRPPSLRDPIPQDILDVEPGSPFVLIQSCLPATSKCATRSGSRPLRYDCSRFAGYSGISARQVVFQSSSTGLGQGADPPDVLTLLRMGG